MIDAKTPMLLGTYAKHAAFNCAVGLIGASLGKTDKVTAAIAFVIHGLLVDIFESITTLTISESEHPKVFYATMLIGNILIDLTAIAAFRKLKIIGEIGTAFFGGITLITSANRVNHLIKLQSQ